MAYVPLADQDQEMEMHHPHSWVEKYVWSQDHKVIAIQYGGLAVLTGSSAWSSPFCSDCSWDFLNQSILWTRIFITKR